MRNLFVSAAFFETRRVWYFFYERPLVCLTWHSRSSMQTLSLPAGGGSPTAVAKTTGDGQTGAKSLR